MAKVGPFIVSRYGDGLFYASWMGHKISPGFHNKSRARLFARLIYEGELYENIPFKAPGDKPGSWAMRGGD